MFAAVPDVNTVAAVEAPIIDIVWVELVVAEIIVIPAELAFATIQYTLPAVRLNGVTDPSMAVDVAPDNVAAVAPTQLVGHGLLPVLS